MARLVSPATKTLAIVNPVSKIPRPVPIQSASSRTFVNVARGARRHLPTQSASSRTPLSASMALRHPPARLMPASSRTTPRTTSVTDVVSRFPPALLAPAVSSRTNSGLRYRAPRDLSIQSRTQANMIQTPQIKHTRIPAPTTTAVQKARSQILIRRPTVIFRPQTHSTDEAPLPSVPSSEVVHSSEEPDQPEEATPNEDIISYEDVSDASDYNSEDENTSLLFNDNSFDDSIDPEQQTVRFNLFERRLVAYKRLGKERRIAQHPWFVGLARCPGYIGDTINKPRVRPPRKLLPRALQQNQLHSHYNAPNAPATSQLPYLVWPLVKRAVVPARSTVATPKVVSSAIPVPIARSTRTTKRKIAKVNILKNVSAASSKALTKTDTFKALVVGESQPSPSSRQSTTASKPTATRDTEASKLSGRAGPSPARRGLPVRSVALRSNIARVPSSKPRKRQPGRPALKSSLRQADSDRQVPGVHFFEGPLRPRFYDLKTPATDSALDLDDEWTPLELARKYPKSSQAKGMVMFEPTSRGTLTLKLRTLLRYKSVREYEERRREEVLTTGKRPELGQLEYGNADYKIALQATDVITSYDIGTLQAPSAIGKKGIPTSTYNPVNGPLLVFGAFKEPFTDVIIPAETAKAYKKPICWPATASDARWKKFDKQHLRSLQAAELEG
ncbi:uncharacterized protein K460DRAFT_411873 [Cucurbitaria berberidis CBS 394.84]|uniref:Uncharacterized protein n=1 Tax=Cucurbitaria berberidis CBS 394.84 TaxID=1168544 RepID=A0A9P4GS78_9PLEO|nr:uncharacterized protein K460DRAFT_411873 [Cucurbitaria berberidis CBS 394.84]KAF1850106.1 hypothetical protein K460DRAFT_411873 [Cucurbitaria berberidis CBS 394.84]